MCKLYDVLFEMKRYSEGKDLASGIINHFRNAYRKSDKIVLHIAQKADFSNLKRVIRKANIKYPQIKQVLLVYAYKAIMLDKDMIQKADYLI